MSNAVTSFAKQFSAGDEEQLANRFNSTFHSVSASLPKLTPTHQHPMAPIPHKYEVYVEEVDKKLFKLDIKKASGQDGIPTWVLKGSSGHLAPPIAAIFNSSFRE